MFSINSLTCGLAPPKSKRGRAVTVRPFKERALLTVATVSMFVLGFVEKRLTSYIDLTGFKCSRKIDSNTIERHALRKGQYLDKRG